MAAEITENGGFSVPGGSVYRPAAVFFAQTGQGRHPEVVSKMLRPMAAVAGGSRFFIRAPALQAPGMVRVPRTARRPLVWRPLLSRTRKNMFVYGRGSTFRLKAGGSARRMLGRRPRSPSCRVASPSEGLLTSGDGSLPALSQRSEHSDKERQRQRRASKKESGSFPQQRRDEIRQ